MNNISNTCAFQQLQHGNRCQFYWKLNSRWTFKNKKRRL